MYTSINQKMYNRIRANCGNNVTATTVNNSVTLDDGWIDSSCINNVGSSSSNRDCCMTSKVLNHRYKIIQLIGKGSFSQVYEAYDIYHPRYKDKNDINKMKLKASGVSTTTDVNRDYNINNNSTTTSSSANNNNRYEEGADKVVIKIVRRGYHAIGIREHIMLQHLAAATGSYGNNTSSSSSLSSQSYSCPGGQIQNQLCT